MSAARGHLLLLAGYQLMAGHWNIWEIVSNLSFFHSFPTPVPLRRRKQKSPVRHCTKWFIEGRAERARGRFYQRYQEMWNNYPTWNWKRSPWCWVSSREGLAMLCPIPRLLSSLYPPVADAASAQPQLCGAIPPFSPGATWSISVFIFGVVE